MSVDKIVIKGKSQIQYGPNNKRVYLMELHPDDRDGILDKLDKLAKKEDCSKIIVKVPAGSGAQFRKNGYVREAVIPRMYNNRVKGYFLSRFLDPSRRKLSRKTSSQITEIISASRQLYDAIDFKIWEGYEIRMLDKSHVKAMKKTYKSAYDNFPFPVFKGSYLRESLASGFEYFGVFKNDSLIAVSAAQVDKKFQHAELLNFGVHSKHLGKNLPYFLLTAMTKTMNERGIKTLYTLSPATHMGMNKIFGRQGFNYAGTLRNDALINDRIESMNVWFKNLDPIPGEPT